MSVGSNNPAMRLYKFDTDSGQVSDGGPILIVIIIYLPSTVPPTVPQLSNKFLFNLVHCTKSLISIATITIRIVKIAFA